MRRQEMRSRQTEGSSLAPTQTISMHQRVQHHSTKGVQDHKEFEEVKSFCKSSFTELRRKFHGKDASRENSFIDGHL